MKLELTIEELDVLEMTLKEVEVFNLVDQEYVRHFVLLRNKVQLLLADNLPLVHAYHGKKYRNEDMELS